MSIVEEKWSPEWSNAVFSLEERDRRWALVRKLMAKAGIDVIVCFPLTHQHGRGDQAAGNGGFIQRHPAGL